MLPLDELDRRLLRLLQDDSGRTLHDLGERVGLSASAVQRRITRYRADGLLVRQIAVLDPATLGSMSAIALVALDRESADHHREFRERMLAEPGVQQCFSIVGQWDYLVVLVAPGIPEYRALAERLFLTAGNIRRYETLPTYEVVKRGLDLPLD
ncbi:Lrp/AsnC family transcriptional regulator [Amycolatopsis suaedae]|uniref:Lrp/AsnC family transcriptional regulator n=1 Tax=Amycolatopsis suaedae TaxID=2510978 RepID=A0A4Q7J996_9PSEU|nr:Lrp/AsnC family transcriptional regulator [Amycolatopsis suaedae]RZQ62973.1 Lrp/AsnC family transcriptional regulator [Amycolatopsis suaedae]